MTQHNPVEDAYENFVRVYREEVTATHEMLTETVLAVNNPHLMRQHYNTVKGRLEGLISEIEATHGPLNDLGEERPQYTAPTEGPLKYGDALDAVERHYSEQGVDVTRKDAAQLLRRTQGLNRVWGKGTEKRKVISVDGQAHYNTLQQLGDTFPAHLKRRRKNGNGNGHSEPLSYEAFEQKAENIQYETREEFREKAHALILKHGGSEDARSRHASYVLPFMRTHEI